MPFNESSILSTKGACLCQFSSEPAEVATPLSGLLPAGCSASQLSTRKSDPVKWPAMAWANEPSAGGWKLASSLSAAAKRGARLASRVKELIGQRRTHSEVLAEGAGRVGALESPRCLQIGHDGGETFFRATKAGVFVARCQSLLGC